MNHNVKSASRPAYAVNVFELGCIVAPFGVGYFLGLYLSQILGVWGWIIGAPLGFFGSIGLYATLDRLLGLSESEMKAIAEAEGSSVESEDDT